MTSTRAGIGRVLKNLFFGFVSVFVLSLAFAAVPAGATSGACSGHGGVNCAAGADKDGSVICYDGWRKSTVSYKSMVMCSPKVVPKKVTTPATLFTPKKVTTPKIIVPKKVCCKVCTTGQACGNSCISARYTCHKAPGCACNAY
jgi:hypothetical protein